MTLSRKGQSLFDMTSENFGRLDECVKFVRDNGFDFKTEVPSDTELVVDNPVGVGDDNNKEAIKVQKLSFNNGYVVFIPTENVTFTVKDSLNELQSGVKIYRNDTLIGTTDVNGEAVLEVAENDTLIFGKSGFFIKEYTSTLDLQQNIELSYVIPIVKIGNQVWHSENLSIDDLQGDVYSPDGNAANVNDYGYIYTQVKTPKLANLVPSFEMPIQTDVDTLTSEVSFDGGKLKESGTTHWDTGNTGTNESGFSARGSGYSNNLGQYFRFKQEFRMNFLSGVFNVFILTYNNDTTQLFNDANVRTSARLIKSSTPDTFIFSISVNSGGAAVQGATVSVEGNDYITDANGQVFIEEYKTNVNFTASKTGYVTATGSIDLTSEFTKIVSLVNEVTIGTQTWSAFNLDIDDGQGGIISVNDGSGYGKLYTYAAAQRIADSIDGWRLPTEADIDTLTAFVGGASVAGRELKETGTTYWNTTGGTNNFGFNGRGAGGYNSGYFNFQQLQEFWTSTNGGPANTKVTQKMSATTDSSFKGALDVNFWSVSLRLIKE